MSYSIDTKIHTTFDNYPLANAVTGNLYTSATVQNIVDGVFDSAWEMSQLSTALITDPLNPSTACTIGFWLNPVNPGVVTDTSNNTLPLLMPVLAKATFIPGSNVTASPWTFIVWEETQTDGTNKLKASFRGLQGITLVSATISSSPYEVGIFHHFWLVYNGTLGEIKLYIDTIEDISAIVTGTIPVQLSSNAAPLTLNDNVIGPKFQIARNSGIIDDLIIFTSVKDDSTTIVRAANSGAKYVGDVNFANIQEIDQALIFDDPGIAQINSVYSNRGRLYVGRSDGKLMRGTKLLWETRFDFSNASELNELQIVSSGTNSLARVSAGSLKLQDNIVRV